MKIVLKIFGLIVVCVALLLIAARMNGFGPHGNTPGLWLDLLTTPATDWSFTNETVNVQSNTWYLPHSVTIVASHGQHYLTSVYRAGLEYPHGRNWNTYVAPDPLRQRLEA